MSEDPEKNLHLLEKLGEGSYGTVHKARTIPTNAIVAVKIVPVDNDLDEVIKEINIMKQCKNEYVIEYYGSYFKDSGLWIVMEYCGAGSVSDLMRLTKKTLTEEQIACVCLQVLKGLKYLHGIRKIHRDIKAGNILLNEKGEAKLADFGVSGQLSDNYAKRQTVIGTPYWMAPEVIQEIGHDVKADIWSLGITTIEMAESKPPHSNIHPMRAIFMIPSRPPPTLQEPDKWSSDFKNFLEKCLTKNPDERPDANTLLEHPFIKKAKPPSALTDIIDEAQHIIAEFGRDGRQNDTDEESPDGSGDDQAESGTVVKGAGGSSATAKSVNLGTIEGDGTMVTIGSTDDGDSDTIKQKKQQQINDYQAPYKKNKDSEYASYTLEELKDLLKKLEEDRVKEIEALKKKYMDKKQQLQKVIELKKS
jgi:serine/threonine protein kinase